MHANSDISAKNTVRIVYAGESKASLKFEDIFLLEADKLVSVEYSDELVKAAGPQNVSIGLGRELEYLCRLIETVETCFVTTILPGSEEFGKKYGEENQGDISAEEFSFVYAYLLRHHLKSLQKKGTLEETLNSVSLLMQRRGCFDEFQRQLNCLLTNETAYERLAAKTAPFLILKGNGDTCGGVLRQFADDLAEALAENGQAVILWDGEAANNHDDGWKKLNDNLDNRIYQGVVGFQAPALHTLAFQKLHGPKFQFWFDNPFSFDVFFHNLPEDLWLLCQDADHAAWIRDNFHGNALQFPPGGVELEEAATDRPMDVIFMGRFFPDEPETLTGEQRIFYDYFLEHPGKNFEQGAKELICQGRLADKGDFPGLMYSLKSACRAVVGHYRNNVVETILQAGIPLHVYGEDWKRYSGKGKENLILHPEVPAREALREFRRAKIALNVMSWYKAGMTERIANIMLSGAVCLTDETRYLSEHMTGEEIVRYHLEDLESLPGIIRDLLRDESGRSTMAQKALQKARQEFSWKARAKELISLADEYWRERRELRIYVATHVQFKPPQNPIYIPLHVGRKGKQDLGYLGDDTGENISDLNFLYGELTGLFWIWQNVWDADFVGLCHYRRYFINSKMQAMEKGEYLSLLRECDAIVPKHMDCEGGCTYYEQFGKAHNCRDLDAVERALKRLYPEYGPAYDEAMTGSIFYWGNLVVTGIDILKAYAEWLFAIFLEAGEEIDVSGYDAYHKRVYGFLSEQMFYVFAMANGLKLREVAVGVSAEKAETGELKSALRQMLSKGKRKEALELMERSLQGRPDLLLPGSDVNGELLAIYHELKQNS